MSWETVIGLEIHAQLITGSKAFCRCPNRYGDPPNTLTCPTCLGMPGALPVLNREVVRQAATLALALGATIHERSKFDRKNYFYPDLPKGYQISQYDEPFSTGGFLEIAGIQGKKRVGITRAHIEEDAGKSIHQPDGSTIVDMNRCGVPLVEIVSEPEMFFPSEAGAFVTGIRELLRYIGVCDGNMERGSLRCDANISVRRAGQSKLSERCEIKNLNSIRGIERAIDSEARRQIAIYEDGGSIHRQTLLWDEIAEMSRPMRRKEGSDDYRYFPEPDLVELRTSLDQIAQWRGALPELPNERRIRYRDQLGLHEEAVSLLAPNRELGDYFEAVISAGADPRSAANWVQGEVQRILTERSWTIEQFPLAPPSMAELIETVRTGRISNSQAKEVLRRMIDDGGTVQEVIQSEGMEQVSDQAELRSILVSILNAHPDDVKRFRAGKKNLLGFFMGEVMKQTKGRANPKVVTQLLNEMLNSTKSI